ncbi:Ig-like domain-containing protein [Puniceicoccaceae bacterium K14]|nr:Ig-like domain-containing protein [Puniceicoccaceae bacterium K14]
MWDGNDLSPLVFGNGTLGTRVMYWLWNSNSNRWAVRQGDWKIVHYGSVPTSSTDWQLFNLASDPRESNNLATTNTAKLDEMHAIFLAQRESDFTGSMVNPRLTASPTTNGPFTVNVAFTTSVTGLELSDFDVTNGTASNLTGSGSAYTIEVAPTLSAEGTVIIRLPANSVTATAGPNIPSNSLQVDYLVHTNPSITPYNRGVAGQEEATGSGYIMYTKESVHTRFAATTPHMYNADHFIAVRHNGTTWQYDTNVAYASFTPMPSDILVAKVDFTTNTATMLAGTDTTTNGIATGYQSGDFKVLADRWNGGPNTNEFDLQGDSLLLNDGTQLGSPISSTPQETTASLFAPWATSATPILVDIEFSEAVTGLSIDDFTISNSKTADLSGSAASYQLEITPDTQGPISIQLASEPVNQGTVKSSSAITHWNDYYHWANGIQASITIPNLREPNENIDGDLLSNYQEFIFGGNPEIFDVNSPPVMTISSATNQFANIVIRLRDTSLILPANELFEYSTDLLDWSEPGLSQIDNPSAPSIVSIGPPTPQLDQQDNTWGNLSLYSFPISTADHPRTLYFRLRRN